MRNTKVIGIVSGYFNPVHKGHIELFEKAKEIVDTLIVIVNNDEQVKLKGSVEFQREDERVKIIQSLKPVDVVYLSIDTDKSVVETLKMAYEKFKKYENQMFNSDNNVKHSFIFLNGGDQFSNSVAERDVCIEYGIYMMDGLGGKIQSSSDLLRITH